MIINTQDQYNSLLERMDRELHVCTPIFRDIYLHPHVNRLYCIVYTFISGDTYTVSLSSKDAPIFPTPNATTYTFTTSPWIDGHDVMLLAYLHGITITQLTEYYTNYIHTTYTMFDRVSDINRVIPLTVWTSVLRAYHQPILSVLEEHYQQHISHTFHDLHRAFSTLRTIEMAGVHVDMAKLVERYGDRGIRSVNENLVYTQYNPYTTTGRPSNRFNGINFAALPKHDGTRKIFTSRFLNGSLLQFDFDAYHLRLLGNRANVSLPMTPLHEYLGKLYFNTTHLSPEQYDQAKQHTFQVLYGDDVDTDVTLLQQIKIIADTVYDEYLEHGYIRSPIFKRRMYIKEDQTSKNKIFNYYVQSLEFEHTVRILENLLEKLILYQSRVVLYTYDAILIDVHPDEYAAILDGVPSILEHNGFPVKIYAGTNYHDIKKI